MPFYAQTAVIGFEPDPKENVMTSLFKQYEFVIVDSLVTSFGLNFLIKDQHGGDVDTIHNVRQIGIDSDMEYKNQANKTAYEDRGDYNTKEYHSHKAYKEKNREVSAQRKAGKLIDEYTGEKIPINQPSDLDHVQSAKSIHDDRGRVLAGLNGADLANSDENLAATNRHTNRSKKTDSMSDYLDKHGDEYTDEQKQRMMSRDKTARDAYEKKLAKAYYTSSQFAKDTAMAAGKLGVSMGLKQALGFMFTNIWFAVKEEFQKVEFGIDLDLGEFFSAIGNGIKRGLEKTKADDVLKKALEGAVSGVLSSLSTTLCNIFFTTAKNVVKIIRMTWSSIVQAVKVLFINPDNYELGDRLRAVAKILATGASIVVGTVIGGLIGETPVGKIPVIGDIVQIFCGTLISGILSCSLLFFLDKCPLVTKLVNFLNSIDKMDKTIEEMKRINVKLDCYAAELMNIDIETFKRETEAFNDSINDLDSCSTETELNAKLYKIYDEMNIRIPWDGYDSFDNFKKDKNARLVFD